MLTLCASLIIIFMQVLFVLDCASVHSDFFTTVVELTNSPFFHLHCVTSFLAGTILLWFLACSLFFGELSQAERSLVYISAPLYITDCTLVPLSVGVPLLSSAGAIVPLTVVVGLLHRLARERVKKLRILEDPSVRIRMLSRLIFFLAVAMPLDLYVVFNVLAKNAWHQEELLSLHYCMALMYLQFAFSNLKSVVQLLLTEVIGETNNSCLVFYVELSFSLIRSSIFFASLLYVSMVSQPPFPLVRLLLRHIVIVYEKIHAFVRYWTLTKLLDSISNATEKDLSHDPRCAICYDDMTPQEGCKQLSCGHCYHKACLRRWFETMSTCPYCRADLMQQVRKVSPRNIRNATTTNGNDDNNNNADRTSFSRSADEHVDPPLDHTEQQLQLLNELEIRRAYMRYLRRWQTAAIAAQQQLTETQVEQQGLQPSSIHDPTAPISLSSENACNITFTTTSGAPSALHGENKPGEKTEVLPHNVADSYVLQNTQPRTKENELLAAHMEYVRAIKAASEAFERRLQAIEGSF